MRKKREKTGREAEEKIRKEWRACSIFTLLFYVKARACNDCAQLHARNRIGLRDGQGARERKGSLGAGGTASGQYEGFDATML